MVKKMNKSYFLEQLKEETHLSEKDVLALSSILDDHFVFGKTNKEKIVSDIIKKLNVSLDKAEEIYNITMSIISKNIKDKVKHPFKSQD